MRIWVICGLLAWSQLAVADDDPVLGSHTERTFANLAFATSVEAGNVRLAFVADGTTRIDKPYLPARGAGAPTADVTNVVESWADDRTAAWAVADIQLTAPAEAGWDHAVMVVDHTKGSHVVAWSVETTVTDAAQLAALEAGILPPAIPRKIDPGAEDAVKWFEKTITDPKMMAVTVSERNDTKIVYFGSGKHERYTGSVAIRAALAKWNLKLAVRDGVQAGVAGKSVVWIAANVDATALAYPKAQTVPYRLFAVYADTPIGWTLVAASFGAVTKREPFEP